MQREELTKETVRRKTREILTSSCSPFLLSLRTFLHINSISPSFLRTPRAAISSRFFIIFCSDYSALSHSRSVHWGVKWISIRKVKFYNKGHIQNDLYVRSRSTDTDKCDSMWFNFRLRKWYTYKTLEGVL